MEEYKNFLTPSECEQLIKMIDANHSRSSVVEGGTDRTAISDYRTSSTCNLDPNNLLIKNIHNRIANLLGIDIKKGEALQGQLYEVGQYFKQHNDFFEGDASVFFFNLFLFILVKDFTNLWLNLFSDFQTG